MLATFAFDVCHDVYRAARESIDEKFPTVNLDASGKYLWRPDRAPRLAEYVCDFARAGEKALWAGTLAARGSHACATDAGSPLFRGVSGDRGSQIGGHAKALEEPCTEMPGLASPLRRGEPFGRRQAPVRAAQGRDGRASNSRLVMFRVFYLGGAEYAAARRHLGISEFTWADWADEIRRDVGRELMRCGLFPPAKYFGEMTERAS